MKRNVSMTLAGLVIAALVFLCGCRPPAAEPAPRQGKLKVVTTFFPVYCFTANVAGDLADVENLLPPGQGPHGYTFVPSNARTVSSAQLIVMNGAGLDDWLKTSLRNLASKHKPNILEMTADMADRMIEIVHDDHGHGHDHGHHHHGAHDPHVWLDPQMATIAVDSICTALQKADPKNAEGYKRNAEAYKERLKTLDAEIAKNLENIKKARFVTFHNAFPYFIRRYGLTQPLVVEDTPDVSPSPKQQQKLYESIRESKARVLFTEPQFVAKLADRISKDLNIPLAELDPLETGILEPNAYEEAMRKNVRTLQKHLK
ncbi:MAG: zinc transport system substrate-binding protein [Candidatus Binatia bacterium]|jgi:zinc transport system substrate-binding protein